MKVYVAAKYQEMERARKVMDLLVAAGHVITFDWTADTYVRAEAATDLPRLLAAGGPLDGQALEVAREMSVLDIGGVRNADVLVLLGHPGAQGSLVELGAALALGRPVVFSRREPMSLGIFVFHPSVVIVSTDADAVAFVGRSGVGDVRCFFPLAEEGDAVVDADLRDVR